MQHENISRKNVETKRTNKFVIGVDPGLTGAVAVINTETNDLETVFDMPVTKMKGRKDVIDAYSLNLMLSPFMSRTHFVMIEEVNAMPQQGVVSTFRFGFVTGVVHGIVASYLTEIKTVKPSIWKILMKLSSNKSDSLNSAIQLFPSHAKLFKRKMDDGRAEASLLAWFGKDRFLGKI